MLTVHLFVMSSPNIVQIRNDVIFNIDNTLLEHSIDTRSGE